MPSSYSYIGLPISPSIAEALILEIFAGRTVQRHEIVDEVLKAHLQRGGVEGGAVDIHRTIKKALEAMRRRHAAENPSQRFWRIVGEASSVEQSASVSQQNFSPPRLEAEIIYGDGSGSVYLYYLRPYEQLAREQGKNIWLCKIGRTERDPALRILSQAGTALPEPPCLARHIRTDQPAIVESALHSILKIRGRHSIESPGAEWFYTNPEEIDDICRFLGFRCP